MVPGRKTMIFKQPGMERFHKVHLPPSLSRDDKQKDCPAAGRKKAVNCVTIKVVNRT
jgi:hypothetical protein